MGRLLVSQMNSAKENGVTLLNITGNQGQHWKQTRVELKPAETYVLSFEAILGYTFEGDVAIDDIAIIDDCRLASVTPNCPGPNYHQCNNGNCIPSFYVCNDFNDCGDEVSFSLSDDRKFFN